MPQKNNFFIVFSRPFRFEFRLCAMLFFFRVFADISCSLYCVKKNKFRKSWRKMNQYLLRKAESFAIKTQDFISWHLYKYFILTSNDSILSWDTGYTLLSKNCVTSARGSISCSQVSNLVPAFQCKVIAAMAYVHVNMPLGKKCF